VKIFAIRMIPDEQIEMYVSVELKQEATTLAGGARL
jgi:hypothetical protein